MAGEPIQLAYAGTLDETLVIEEADGTITCTAPLRAGNGPRPAVMWVTIIVMLFCIAFAILSLIDLLNIPPIMRSTRPFMFDIEETYFLIAKPIVFGLSMACFLAACVVVLQRYRKDDAVIQFTLTPTELTLSDPTRSKIVVRWPRGELRGFECTGRRRDLRWQRIADLSVVLAHGQKIPLLRRVRERELNNLLMRLTGGSSPLRRELRVT